MAMKTAAEVAAKWQRNSANAVEDFKKGIQAVTESPTQKAAQHLDRAAANFAAAVSSGRMARKLQAVTLQQWQAAATGKGAQRFASGVQAATPKMAAFMQAFLPVAQAASQEVQSMPKGTTEAAVDRVRAVISKFKQFAGKE
jgi:hypothetical protein